MLEDRPHLCDKKFTNAEDRITFQEGWKEIADELNQIPDGAVKTPEQWMTVWRDFKSRACMKAAKLQNEKVQPNNKAITITPLTEFEKRIIALICTDYAFDDFCEHSMQEDDSNEAAQDSKGADLINTHQTQSVSSRTAATVPSTPTVEQPRRKNRYLHPRRSVAELHNEARRELLAVAQSNAQSMRMLAKSTQLHAEAAKMQAESSLLFAQAANKIGDALILLANKENKK
ncbi:uncharacterized protein LOC115453515 isoform X2 [Manduca sexta]|nr:uncharacterized protein LOC115453515 isoform X2 [Manduca sexta]